MKNIFENPKIGQRVILSRNGHDTTQRIVDVTPRAIRVSSCNLYRFNRNGRLHKSDSRDGDIKASIKPINA